MTIIAHISDTHFGAEVDSVVEALRHTLDNIKPEITILSGDITQRALPSEFEAAKKFFDSLAGNIKIAIPGNHDIPLYNIFTRFLMPYNNYNQAFSKRETVWKNDNLVIVALDATSPYRHTNGKLNEDYIRRHLDGVKAASGSDVILMVVAHQPLLTALPEDRNEVLINTEVTASIFEDYEVDIVLSGHVHFPLFATTEGHFAEIGRNFIIAGAGTAVSRRTRSGAPNSFNIIDMKNRHLLEITKYELSSNTGEFVPHLPTSFGYNNERGWLKI